MDGTASRHGCAMILQRIFVRNVKARHACDVILFSIIVLRAGTRHARGVTISNITAHQVANAVLNVFVGKGALVDECLKPLLFKSGVCLHDFRGQYPFFVFLCMWRCTREKTR